MASKVYERRFTDVLEIGSMDVNGSVRPLIVTETYTGVDILPGPSVDQVIDPLQPLPFPGASFDAVVSCECLEHASRPWAVVSEAARVAKDGAMVLFTARGWFPNGAVFQFHHPPDLWRFSADAMTEMALAAGLTVVECVPDPQVPGFFLEAKVG